MQFNNFLCFRGGHLVKQKWNANNWQVKIDSKPDNELDISINNSFSVDMKECQLASNSHRKIPVFTIVVDDIQQLKAHWLLGGTFAIKWIFLSESNTSSDMSKRCIVCQDKIDISKNAAITIVHQPQTKNTELIWKREVHIATKSHLDWFCWVDDANLKLCDKMALYLDEAKSEFWAGVGQVLSSSLASVKRDWQIVHHSFDTQSRVTTKSVLSNGAQTTDRCSVIVQPSASTTSTKVYQHALLLDDLSKAQAAPEMEVYCEEVECLHGTTSGHPDEEALFYLASRGIEAPIATSLVIEGFLKEVKLPQELA